VLNNEILTSYVAARTTICLQSLEIMADATEISFQNNLSQKDGLVKIRKKLFNGNQVD